MYETCACVIHTILLSYSSFQVGCPKIATRIRACAKFSIQNPRQKARMRGFSSRFLDNQPENCCTCALMFARGSGTWLNIKHAHIRHSCNDIHCVSHVLCEALVLTGIILTCGQRETTNIEQNCRKWQKWWKQ